MFDFKKITIIGVGLIGSSLALAVKKQGFKGTITGVGRNEPNLIKAKELGIIDSYSISRREGVRDADLIVLATPAGQFEQIVTAISSDVQRGAIITDVGSVKAEVTEKLDPLMPEGVSFVGAHPIAGKECPGIEAATAELFENARCILTPTPKTDSQALHRIRDLWNRIGTDTVEMTPQEHDLVFAAVSHMPHVAAYALVNAILDTKDDILQYGGKGLKDMTRIALSPVELWRDICSCNRE